MSVWKELQDLAEYTNSNVGYNSWVGDRDPGADEYPVIRYLTQAGDNYQMNTQFFSSLIKVNVEIIVKKENELKAWEVYENWLQKIMQYNDHKGHELDESYEIERDENIFKIIPVIIIKMMIQDT